MVYIDENVITSSSVVMKNEAIVTMQDEPAQFFSAVQERDATMLNIFQSL